MNIYSSIQQTDPKTSVTVISTKTLGHDWVTVQLLIGVSSSTSQRWLNDMNREAVKVFGDTGLLKKSNPSEVLQS